MGHAAEESYFSTASYLSKIRNEKVKAAKIVKNPSSYKNGDDSKTSKKKPQKTFTSF